MKLLVLADKDVGLRVLELLIEHYPADIGMVIGMEENSIVQTARRSNLRTVVFQGSQALADLVNGEGLEFDLGLLAWWPTLIRPSLISVPYLGFLNFHPSLLPHNRGKHYNFWALVEEAPFGVTLHFVEEKVDSGDICAQREIPYDWTDTGESLYYKAQEAMVRLFCESYPVIRTGNIARQRQDLSKGSFHNAAELEPASRIDLDRKYTGREILNLLRARTFHGHPACRFKDQGRQYEVRVDIREAKE